MSKAPEMHSNSIQNDTIFVASPNCTLNWSQKDIELSLGETFSSNFEDYNSFDPLVSYSMRELDCLAPGTLCMGTDALLDIESCPPLSPVSLIQSVGSYCFASTFDDAADHVTQSSISELQPQTSDGTSCIVDTTTTSLYNEIFTETSTQNGIKSIFPKAKSAFPATELNQQLVTPSTKGKSIGPTRSKDCSGANRDEPYKAKKPRNSRKRPITKKQEALERKNFLERNRIAANKCRKNRKMWINDLEEKYDRVSAENALSKAALDEMAKETIQLRRTVVYLKRICSVISELPPDLRRSIEQQSEPGDLGSPPNSECFPPFSDRSHATAFGDEVERRASHASSPAISSEFQYLTG